MRGLAVVITVTSVLAGVTAQDTCIVTSDACTDGDVCCDFEATKAECDADSGMCCQQVDTTCFSEFDCCGGVLCANDLCGEAVTFTAPAGTIEGVDEEKTVDVVYARPSYDSEELFISKITFTDEVQGTIVLSFNEEADLLAVTDLDDEPVDPIVDEQGRRLVGHRSPLDREATTLDNRGLSTTITAVIIDITIIFINIDFTGSPWGSILDLIILIIQIDITVIQISIPCPTPVPTMMAPTPEPIALSPTPIPTTLEPTIMPIATSPTPVCPPGSDMCMDPHLQGLRGQRIDVSGVDGGWYCLIKDDEIDLHVNVRFTAPLPHDFPHRQLITGLAILSNQHSVVIEARNPYDVKTDGCPPDVSPCLVDGGLRIVVDGEEVTHLLRSTRDEEVVDGIALSASNLPVECRQFGGDKIWASMFAEMLEGRRQLLSENFEDWVLRFNGMAAYDWCKKYISEQGLRHVQSNHAAFKISTHPVVVRLNAGVNHQGDGEVDYDGTILPDLDFWQMDVGFEGLSLQHPGLTGILGETARPVLDEEGHEMMEGYSALRGTVEDYRVPSALGTTFALLGQHNLQTP